MKRLVVIAFLLAVFVVPQVHAQTAAREVWMEKAEVNVRLTGWFAETEFDLTFRNDGNRAAEGELALPLPPGATVSGYALDVNGKMRDAVSVEKERARNAYETVKRRMIDPGIVEREAENIYRTKVYPIPAHGTKRLIIRYHERLAEMEGRLNYRLPFAFTNNLGSFTCRVKGSRYEIVKNAGLEFSGESLGGNQLASLTDARPDGALELKIETPSDGIATIDSGSTPAFHLRLPKIDLPTRPIPHPKTVMLLWDASGSMAEANHQETFSLLDAWFAKLENTMVRLRLVRNEIEDAGDFDVQKGDWKALRRKLEELSYDGGSDFSKIEVMSGADLAVWVTDACPTLGGGMPRVGIPLALIGCGDFSDDSLLATRFRRAGASVIDLARAKREKALTMLTHQVAGLLEVVGDLKGEVMFDHDPVSGTIEIFGRLSKIDSPKLSLRFGYSNQEIFTREILCRPHSGSNALMERILAQRKLAQLESNPKTSPMEIIAHCKEYGLVSDFTSLIVLERIEDYAEHGIVPPEPELRESYDKLVGKKASQRRSDQGGLTAEWEKKMAWHARRFPGCELVILPRMKQVGIWRKAVESQFSPEQRDMNAFNAVAGWHDRALELVVGKNGLKTSADYDKWKEGIDQLYEEGLKLADTPLSPPPEGRELAVSVRGVVAKPGVVKGDAKMTLKQAIANSGGPGPLNVMENVALYRNAGKIVYNTLSEQFKDLQLFPADMIVVGAYEEKASFGYDPFAEAPEPIDPRKDVPIRSEEDIWVAPRAERTEDVPVEEALIDDRTAKEVKIPGVASAPFSAADMEQQLDAGKDATEAYYDFRVFCGGNPEFYPAAARVLVSRKHEALARQVLSNMAENGVDPVSSKRAYAFWLADLGLVDEAEKTLGSIVGYDRTRLLVQRDRASLRSARGEWKAAYREVSDVFDQLPAALSGLFSGVTLTEINALRKLGGDSGPRSALTWHPAEFLANLHADVRITVTAASDSCRLSLMVVEPGNVRPAQIGSLSPYGGRLSGAFGVKEYMIRRAVPGIYKICCGVSHPTTLRIEIHTDFGRPQQKTRVLTVYADHSVPEAVTELDFPFRAQAQ